MNAATDSNVDLDKAMEEFLAKYDELVDMMEQDLVDMAAIRNSIARQKTRFSGLEDLQFSPVKMEPD